MKYGAMNFPIKPLLGEMEEVGAMGFDYVELTMDPPEATPQKILAQKRAIKEILKRYGLGILGHLPTFVWTSDLYESLRKVSLQENFNALEAGAELGIEKMVLHPGFITGLGKLLLDRAKGYALESIEAILKRSNQLGLTLCLENMFPQAHFLSQPAEFQSVFEAFPETRLTLDIGHANLGGGRNKSSEFIQRYGHRIGHVHANDNFGKEDNHLPIGAGIIDFERILKELKEAQYDDTMTLEVFSRDRDYLKISKEKIKRMWEAL
ncbi:MAG TPA: sugar phosphate isomerase/epimerase [Thermodesulfobacteriota bacterium]|jgi:sugar phosphate isomerase/epimerase|nr:sugar phosphate isomerase/epimerase [Thermodesulfobacteriota bacterium]